MKPECYGVFRSPQSDAENDCVACFLDRKCMHRFAFNAGLERAAEIADLRAEAFANNPTIQCEALAIAADIRAEKEADHG